MSSQIGIIAALGAGLLSFLSPCVLPLIPGYLSFITGLSTSELSDERPKTTVVLIPALMFVAGFSLVFVGLGASASLVGQFLVRYREALQTAGGIVVIAFGILMLGVIKVPWLYGEARVDLERSRTFGRGAALVMGMAFAAGWTPCVGPMLGSILTLAASSGGASRGAFLLLMYSLGLGIPFLAVSLLFGRLAAPLRWMARYALLINRLAGALLIVVGVLILTGRLAALGAWLTSVLPAFSI